MKDKSKSKFKVYLKKVCLVLFVLWLLFVILTLLMVAHDAAEEKKKKEDAMPFGYHGDGGSGEVMRELDTQDKIWKSENYKP